MPSSSDEVATRQGISPFFSSSSTSTRCSRASEPWWARAISGLGQLVQAQREPLGEAPVVDEDDRGAVLADELEERRVDRGPDRVALARLAHVLERDDDAQVELLARARVDELDGPAARDEATDLLQRALRGREPDALHRPADEALEPLEAERQVRAALRAGDRVHLVDDHDAERRGRCRARAR